jgi:hypothetical protein
MWKAMGDKGLKSKKALVDYVDPEGDEISRRTIELMVDGKITHEESHIRLVAEALELDWRKLAIIEDDNHHVLTIHDDAPARVPATAQSDQLAPPTGTEVELHLDRDPELWSSAKTQIVLQVLREVLNTPRTIRCVRIRFSSVFMTVLLASEDADLLVDKVKKWYLIKYGIIDAEIVGTNVPLLFDDDMVAMDDSPFEVAADESPQIEQDDRALDDEAPQLDHQPSTISPSQQADRSFIQSVTDETGVFGWLIILVILIALISLVF